MAGKHIEVGVVMEDGHISTNGDGGDETIDQLANRLPLPTTDAIKSRRIVVVCRFRGKQGCLRKQSAKIVQMPLIPRAGEHFHVNRIADCNLAIEQYLDTIADRGLGVSKKLDPR